MTIKKLKITSSLNLNIKNDSSGNCFERNDFNKKTILTIRKLKYMGKELKITLNIKEKDVYLDDKQLYVSYICEIDKTHDFYYLSDSDITKIISDYLSDLDNKMEQFFLFTDSEDARGLDQFLDQQVCRGDFHKLTQDENKISRTTLNVNNNSDRKTEIYSAQALAQILSGYKCYSLTTRGKYEMKLKIFHIDTGETHEICCSSEFLGDEINRELVHDIFKSGQMVNYHCSVYIGVASKRPYKYELNSIGTIDTKPLAKLDPVNNSV